MSQPKYNYLILAISPCTRGFGYAVMEGLEKLLDWGLKEARGDKNAVCIQNLAALLQAYQPDGMVIENCTAEKSRRCRRVKELIEQTADLSRRHGIPPVRLPLSAVRETFSQWQAFNKHQRATVIGNLYPELIPRVPPERKCWMSEDPRTNIFNAMALGITFFYNIRRWKRST